MTFSVVIPAYNAELTITQTLESVLGQTAPADKVIVVDDGSSDDTVHLVEAFGGIVRCISQENQGPGTATQRGLSEVETDFVATLDSDDLWAPQKCERQIEHLSRRPDSMAVFTHIKAFVMQPGVQTIAGEGPSAPGWSRTTMLARAELFGKVGPMTDLPGQRGEFIDWLAQVKDSGCRIDMLAENLAYRRIRSGSLAYGRDPKRDIDYVRVARNAILRRRQSSD